MSVDELTGIRWGSATAAYQIEGAIAEGGRTASIWDVFTAMPGATTRGDTGDVACDAYHHPERILDAANWLNLDTYRLSISWSRMMPAADNIPNPEAIAYYRRVLLGMRENQIVPVITLYHWDLPQWIQDQGGWTSLETVAHFGELVRVAVGGFGDLVHDWVTVNEPFCAAFHGHLSGLHAPGVRSEQVALRAAFVLLQAHGEAMRIIRKADPNARAGIALNLSDLIPASNNPEDLAATQVTDLVENRLFLDPVLLGQLPDDVERYFGSTAVEAAIAGIDLAAINTPMDFIGVNYYEHNIIEAAADGQDPIMRGVRKLPLPEPKSANGVAVCPQGFARVLTRVSRLAPKLPLWVTENGIGLWDYIGPDGECRDKERVEFLQQYIPALAEAIRQGARVEAYYFWALVDNFEWANGYQLRYGLFYTDYVTRQLQAKNSAHWYRDLIEKQSKRLNSDLTTDKCTTI